jgi:hypothetical protein
VQGATTRVAENIGLLRSIRCYIAPARAPTPLVSCSDRGATVQLERMAEDVWTRWCVFLQSRASHGVVILHSLLHVFFIQPADCV